MAGFIPGAEDRALKAIAQSVILVLSAAVACAAVMWFGTREKPGPDGSTRGEPARSAPASAETRLAIAQILDGGSEGDIGAVRSTTNGAASSGDLAVLPAPSMNAIATDDEWLRIPRSSMRLEDMVIHGPLDSQLLFRNTHLNPDDVRLSRDLRGAVSTYCAVASSRLRMLEEAKSKVAAAELQERVQRNIADKMDLRSSRQELPPQDRARIEADQQKMAEAFAKVLGKTAKEVIEDPTFGVVVPGVDFHGDVPMTWLARGSTVFSARARDLPNARALLDAQRWLMCEVGCNLLLRFVEAGCLVPASADQIARSLVERVERVLGK